MTTRSLGISARSALNAGTHGGLLGNLPSTSALSSSSPSPSSSSSSPQSSAAWWLRFIGVGIRSPTEPPHTINNNNNNNNTTSSTSGNSNNFRLEGNNRGERSDSGSGGEGRASAALSWFQEQQTMVNAVKEVLPYLSDEVIVAELRKTRDAAVTINNLLDL